MVPKRHHVMKLYKRRWADDPYWDGGRWVYEELDPADLDKMNLDAVMVLGELKKALVYRTDGSIDVSFDAGYNQATKLISDTIADLESAANLKVKAKTWEILKEDEKGLGLGHEMKTALAHACAELSQKGEAKK